LRRSTKALLILEVIICFGLLAPFLLIGAVMVPFQIYALLEDPLSWEGPAELIGQVACGICGLGALTFILIKLLLDAKGPIKYLALIWVGVLLGVLPILDMAIRGSGGWKIFAAIPLIATIHLIALSRRLLFPSVREGLTKFGVAALLVLPLPWLLSLPLFDLSEQNLLERQKVWVERKPSRYQFAVRISGWTDRELLNPKRITVNNGEVESAVYLWPTGTHQQGDPASLGAAWTMDATFDALLAARRRGWSVRAEFDDRWGFVEKAYLDLDKPDSAWDLLISEFKTLEPLP
jgi:hypothetical protein